MNKWKNYGLWVSVASLLTLLMGNYGLYEIIGMNSETFQQVIDIILVILVGAGVISNPTSGKGFTDKK